MKKIISLLTLFCIILFLTSVFNTPVVYAEENASNKSFIVSNYANAKSSHNLIDGQLLDEIDVILSKANSYNDVPTFLYIISSDSKEEIIKKANTERFNAIILDPAQEKLITFDLSRGTEENLNGILYEKTAMRALEEAIYNLTGYSILFEMANENDILDTTSSFEISDSTYEKAKTYNENNNQKIHFVFINDNYSYIIKYSGFAIRKPQILNNKDIFYIIDIKEKTLTSTYDFNYNGNTYNPTTILETFGKEKLSALQVNEFLDDFYTNFKLEEVINKENIIQTEKEKETNEKIVSSFYMVFLFLIATALIIATCSIIIKAFVETNELRKEQKQQEEEKLEELKKVLAPSLDKQEEINMDSLHLEDQNDGLDKYRHKFNFIMDDMVKGLAPQTKNRIIDKNLLNKVKIEYTDEYVDNLNSAIICASSFPLDSKNFITFNNLVEKYNKLPENKKEKIERKYISKVESSRNKLLSSFRLSSYKKSLDVLKKEIKNDKIKENDCFIIYLNDLIKQIEDFDKLDVKDVEVENILNIYIPHLQASIDDYNNFFTNGYFEENTSKKMQDNIITLIKNISESILDKTNSKIYWELSRRNSTLEGLNQAIKLNH